MTFSWRLLIAGFLLVGSAALAFPSASATRDRSEPDESTRCLQCHGNREPEMPSDAPRLDSQFTMQWRMFEFQSKERPPLSAILKDTPYLRGTTYYDWSRQSMTEVYYEKCIDIFPSGRDFPCRFTSVGDTTWFLRYPKGTSAKPSEVREPESCCRWSAAAFWAPRPDVIRNMKRDHTRNAPRRSIEWWWLEVPLPGPFGYGVRGAADRPNRVEPAAFWFPVISGWVQQEFSDEVLGAPDAIAFALPDRCKAAPVCP